jgi:polysaccharide chain length determinant protein (PEP-CTERM system associated)
MTTPETTAPRGQGLSGLLETLRRRKALAIVPFVFVLAATASLAFFLPSLWTSRAVIMVDRQQIPESFVKPTVTNDVPSAILTLSGEIMSKARLLEIIQRHRLYAHLAGKSPDEVVDKMRKDIRIEWANDERDRGRTSTRDRDARMVAFSVSYTATNRDVSTQVTNTLAELFIEENVKLRERQAVGAADFLDNQLTDVRAKLAAQEKRVAEYKEKYMGELPEQRDANLRTLERLQAQLGLAHETHRRAAERKQQITQSLAEIDQGSGPAAATVMNAPTPVSSTAARLNLLKQELVQLQTKYSDKYPDVVYTKEQIRMLEARLAEEQTAAALPKQVEKKDEKKSGLRVIPQNAYVQSLMSQLDQANVEVKTGAEQIAALTRQIAVYDRRIDNTPRREHELALVTRDYETTQTVFRTLLSKREEAGVAANLEQHQKGEHFRIMEAAVAPDRPTGPNRLRLLLIGLVLALGASGAAVVLAENVDTSFRRVDEVRSKLPVPILSTIPRITTEGDVRRLNRARRLVTAAVAVGLFLVIGATYTIAHNNHDLVGLLTPDPTATAKR